MIAREIMQKNVVAASPSMTLKELAALLVEHQITGAPVVNAAGLLVGVVSETDLVRHEEERAGRRPPSGDFYREEFYKPGSSPRIAEEARVRDCMTPIVISANRNDDVREVARMMLEQRVHRLIIAEDGKLYGIVTSMDVVRAFLAESDAARGASAPRRSTPRRKRHASIR